MTGAERPNYERIWLQPFAGEEGGHTWCSTSVQDDDIEYVRADIAADRITALEAEVADLTAAVDAEEKPHGMPWRFWSDKARQLARKFEAAAARIAELEDALKPFAPIADAVLSEAPSDATKAKLWNGVDNSPLYISLDACRALRTTLSKPDAQGGGNAPDHP